MPRRRLHPRRRGTGSGRGGGQGGLPARIGDVDARIPKSAAKISRGRVLLPAAVACSARAAELHGTLSRTESSRSGRQARFRQRSIRRSAPAFRAQNVTMHLVRAGGGFGRRLVSEYDIEVARIAKVVTDERTAAGQPSVPVKLLWTREDDMAHDQYRPAGYHFFKAGLDACGKLIAYPRLRAPARIRRCRRTSSREASSRTFSLTSENVTPFGVPDRRAARSAYQRHLVRHAGLHRRGGHRGRQGSAAVSDSICSTARTAPAPGRVQSGARGGVLEAVRDMSGGTRRASLPKGTGMGVAFQFAHAGYVAYVVEVDGRREQGRSGQAAWCAVDIGRQIVNPSQSENLVHGGFIEGMSHVMNWEITIDKGRVVQTELHRYQPTRMMHAPGGDSRCKFSRRTSIRPVSASLRCRRRCRRSSTRSSRRPACAFDRCRWRNTATAGRSRRARFLHRQCRSVSFASPRRSSRLVRGSRPGPHAPRESTAIAGARSPASGLHGQSSPQERTLVAYDFTSSATDGSCPETPAR